MLTPGNKWLANLYDLAHERLRVCSVDQVWDGEFCIYSDPQHFFSYRRDQVTGRMAGLIWIDPDTTTVRQSLT